MRRAALRTFALPIAIVCLPALAAARPSDEHLARIERVIAAEVDADQKSRGLSTLAQLVARYGRAEGAEAILSRYAPGIDLDTLRFVVATELAYGGAYAAALKLTEGLGPNDQLQIRIEIAKAQLAHGRKAEAVATLIDAKAASARVDYKEAGDSGAWTERRDLYWLGKLQARAGLAKDLEATIAATRRVTGSLGKLIAQGRTKSPSNQLSDYELWVGLGELLAIGGRADEARREFAKALRSAADRKATTGMRGSALAEIGEAQHRSGFAADSRATWKQLETLFARMTPQEQREVHPDVPRDLAFALAVQGRFDDSAATLAKAAHGERFESLSWKFRRLLGEGKTSEARALLDHAERIAPPDEGRAFHKPRDLAQWAEAMRAVLALRSGARNDARQHLLAAIERAKSPEVDAGRVIEHWTNIALVGELAGTSGGIEDLVNSAWDQLVAYIESRPQGCCPGAPASERLSWVAWHLWQHGSPPREGP